jgi:hypothetical protein
VKIGLTPLLYITICFGISGCWVSENDLIDDSLAMNPLSGEQRIRIDWAEIGSTVLYERQPGPHNLFVAFAPDEEGMILAKFVSVETLGVPGSNHYILQFGKSGDWIYAVLRYANKEWHSYDRRSKVVPKISSMDLLLQSLEAGMATDDFEVSERAFTMVGLSESEANDLKIQLSAR